MARSGSYFREGPAKPAPQAMSRSRGQLASSYAPGSIFTFEGGLGACVAVPLEDVNAKEVQLPTEAQRQLFERLQETWRSWYARAQEAGDDKHRPLPRQCIDKALLPEGNYKALSPNQFQLVNPTLVGYIPGPASFVCNKCGRFHQFDTVKEAAASLPRLTGEPCKTDGSRCTWRQLDVIFVHWSGGWSAPHPGRWEWSQAEQDSYRPVGCRQCGSSKFFLNDKSPRIGQWFFTCEAGHKAGDSWLQNDKETTEILGDECFNRPPRWRRMEPISYRATASFYPHSDQFIVFGKEQQKLLELLREERRSDLANSLAGWYGIGSAPLTTEEILQVMEQKGAAAQLTPYRALEEMLSGPMAESNKEDLRGVLSKMVESWREIPGLIPERTEAPPSFLAQVMQRQSYGSRYDPVLLAVEHEALKRGTLEASTLPGERAPFVLFTSPDRIIGPRDDEQMLSQMSTTKRVAARLGIEKIGLIREFELCRFTHGYTRMSNEPIIEKKDSGTLRLPVRLNLFDPFRDSRKRPIYTVTQKNEAIYVQLSPEQVLAWLREVNVADLPDWNPHETAKLNAHLLERAQPFGRFFSDLIPADASTYRYCYTLLHTYAHVVMKAVSEFSGLDLGSLSEYLFPCDMAFVVYRNATTMDLGYMSALWRNSNTEFLKHLGAQESLLCGSGSLCETKGGACPDCIVVPETSCIASNRLLSRSVLGGGLAPREDATHAGMRIPGYLEVIARNEK
ncbi:Uncharacterised protein [Achromobacter sp. 2789STDY5608621]|nr:Uncharacterised protein [Achromobacter sp. 2789STDY5608621]